MKFDSAAYWQHIGEPHAEQARLLDLIKENRRTAATCGRRWGKTWLLSAWSLWRVLRGEQVWWVAPSHLLSRAGFEYCLQHIRQLPSSIRRRISIKRSSPFEVQYGDGWIQFLSADNLWQLQARGLDLVVVDEAGEIDDLLTLHDQYLSPTLLDRGGKLILIGTPRGGTQSHYYQIATRPEYVRFQGRSADNPHLDADELARLEQELPEALRLQELHGEFVDVAGRAFSTIPIDLLDDSIPNNADAVTGIDFGLYSPFSAVLVVRLPDGRFYVCDECYATDVDAHRQAEMVLEMEQRYSVRVIRRVLDSSCFNRLDGIVSIASRYQEKGCHVLPATRDRLGTLALLRQMLNEKRLVISPACKNLLTELRQAEVHPSRYDDIVGDDHALDALRYALAEAVQLQPRKPEPSDPMARFIQRSLRRSGVKV